MRLATVEQNLQLLDQASSLLHDLDDALYAASDHGHAGVGPHLRHCLDFYRCFLRDLAAGRIDYDRRERDQRVETERAAALALIDRVAAELAEVGPADRVLQVRVDCAPGEERAGSAWCGSSVGRELRFLVSHTVHHFALIAGVLRGHGIEPGPEFGVAPSTLSHWHATGQAG